MACGHCGHQILLRDYDGLKCPICEREPTRALPQSDTQPRHPNRTLVSRASAFLAQYCGPYPYLRGVTVSIELVRGEINLRGGQRILMQPCCPFSGDAHGEGVPMVMVGYYGEAKRSADGRKSVRFECTAEGAGHRLSLVEGVSGWGWR